MMWKESRYRIKARVGAIFCSTRFLRSAKSNTNRLILEWTPHMERWQTNRTLTGSHAMTRKWRWSWTMETQASGLTHRHKKIGCLQLQLNSGSNLLTQMMTGSQVTNRFCKCKTQKILRSTSRFIQKEVTSFALRSELQLSRSPKLPSETSATIILTCGAGGMYLAVTPTSSMWRWLLRTIEWTTLPRPHSSALVIICPKILLLFRLALPSTKLAAKALVLSQLRK